MRIGQVINGYSTADLQLLDSIPTLALCKLAASLFGGTAAPFSTGTFLCQKPPATHRTSLRTTNSVDNVFLPTCPLRRATHSISFTGGSGRYLFFHNGR